MAKPEVHNASYRQPKRSGLSTTEKQAAYNLHYVNIALGTVFPGVTFCLSAGAALAGFVFTAEDPTIQKQKPACAAAGRPQKA